MRQARRRKETRIRKGYSKRTVLSEKREMETEERISE